MLITPQAVSWEQLKDHSERNADSDMVCKALKRQSSTEEPDHAKPYMLA